VGYIEEDTLWRKLGDLENSVQGTARKKATVMEVVTEMVGK